MLVYVNKVYLTEDVISKVEIIIHDEINLKNVFYVNDYFEVVEYCKKLKSEGHLVYPLKGEHFIIDPSVTKVKLEMNSVIEHGFREESFVDTVYGLYSTLARSGAILISDSNPYPDGYVGLVSEFSSLTISTKNMEVTIPIMFGSGKVGEFTLISQKGEIVSNNKFKVAVPKDKVSAIYKYNLAEIGDIKINNKEFIIFEYLKDLTIFRDLNAPSISAPIVVRYITQQSFYSEISSLIKNVLMKMNVGSFKDFGDSKIKFSDIFNNYSGVFFRYNDSMSKSDLDKLTDIVLNIGPSIMGKPELDNVNLRKAIKVTLQESGLSENYVKVVLVLFNIYKLSKNKIDLVNSLMLNYSSLKIIRLDIDLYLYTIRLDIYNNCKTLYPGQSLIQLESYGVKVGMEVWKK